MKYWKLKDNSAVESHGDSVDISANAIEITETEYNNFISNLKPDIPVKKDWKFLYQNAATDADKLDVIAKYLKLK